MQNVKKEIIDRIEDKKAKIKEQEDIITKEWAAIKKDLKEWSNSLKQNKDKDKEV